MRTMRMTVAMLIAGMVLAAPMRSLVAKDKDKDADTRKERMEKDKWTNADRARDVLDHLKKAQEELENITNDKESGDAGEALKLVKQSIEKVDKYVEAVDKKAK